MRNLNVNSIVDSFIGQRHRYISSNRKFIYHIGIIDYLQTYNMEKQLESRIKTTLLGRSFNEISAIDPKPYAERFLGFMVDKVFIDGKEQKEVANKHSFIKSLSMK